MCLWKRNYSVNASGSKGLRLAVMGALSVLAMAAHATTNNLVHHWNFDEGQDWHDDAFGSASTNLIALDYVGTANATLTGMNNTNWVSGRQFTALAFDGVNDYLAVTNNLAQTLGGTASLSFWIRTTKTGTSSAGTSPSVTGVAGSNGAQWGWLDNTGRIGLALDNTTVVQSTNSVADGNWHHVVITRRSTADFTCALYVDGILHASAQGPSGAKGAAFYSLGRLESGGTPVCFAGRLDQVHVFNQSLSPSDVQTLFSNHAPKCWTVTSEGVTNRTFTTASIFARTYDVERDTCTVTRWTQPARGTVTHNGDGSFNYTATSGVALGKDSFSVIVSDGRGGFRRGTIEVLTMSDSGMPVTQYTNFGLVPGTGNTFSTFRVPRVLDWDLDGDLDLLVGVNGAIWRWMNTGTASSPSFSTVTRVQAGGVNITAGTGCIAFIDMNGNGVRDLVAINSLKKLLLYVNTRTANQSPVFSSGVIIKHQKNSDFVLPDSRFDLGDWNGDGLPDLVTGTYNTEMRLYLNVGTTADPRFNDTYTSLVTGAYNLSPRLYDLNGNGKMDFLYGVNWGTITYYRDPYDRGLSAATLNVTDLAGVPAEVRAVTDGAFVDFGDFNNDGHLDMVSGGNASSNKLYIGYGVQKTVQQSLAEIEAIYNVNTNNVGVRLSANTNALLTAINTANWNLIAHIQHGTLGTREELYGSLTNHIAKYGFLKYKALDLDNYHQVPSIVGQNWIMLTQALQDTPTRRAEIADVLCMTNMMRTIYLEQGLMLGDGCTSYEATYRTARDFMRRHPRELFPDAALTLGHFNLDGSGGLIWSPNGSKNTFDQAYLGNANEWASDLTAVIEKTLGYFSSNGDYFTFVMGHEVVHSLDGYVNARRNQDLRKRWGLMLCTAAGPDVIPGADGWWDWTATKTNFQSKGYWNGVEANWASSWSTYWATGPGALFRDLSFMRGGIDWFMDNTQESLATQGNHHWANGPGRLIGATDRFRRASAPGYAPMKANINEVVTFIDYLSCGMNRVNLVEAKNSGTPEKFVDWTDHYADLVRNDKGYIQQLTVDGMTFCFSVATNGVVTNVTSTVFAMNADEAWTYRNTPCTLNVLANDQKLEGGGILQVVSVTQPANGSVTNNGNGTVTYTSFGTFTGFDTFAYTVTSDSGGQATALVHVEVVSPAAGTGSLLVEYWNDIGTGTTVSDLTGQANFPASPSEKYYTNSIFELQTDFRENFGSRVRGLLAPTISGNYKFWIASDDNSELWLSTNHEVKNKQRIAYVNGWTAPREWTKYSTQESAPISLVAGQYYYIESLQKEGGGLDNLAVAWSGPNTYTSTNVIPAENLRHPFYKGSVLWAVNGSGLWNTTSPNWFKDGLSGQTFTNGDVVVLPDLAGITNATLTLMAPYSVNSLTVSAVETDYLLAGAPLEAVGAALSPGCKLTITNELSRITDNVSLPQTSVLVIPSMDVLPGGLTPAAADYPTQSRLVLAHGGTLTSLGAVEGIDAQVDVMKTVMLATNFMVTGGQTLRVMDSGVMTLNSLWVGRDNRLIVEGGTVTVNSRLWLNQNSVGGAGRLDVTGGALTVTGPISDNRDSFFIVNQTGGSVEAASLLGTTSDSGNEGGGSGDSYYYLSGGLLTLGSLLTYRSPSWGNVRRINLHIGNATYRASASHTIDDTSTILLNAPAGNASTFNTQGYTLTINTPFSISGAFTKTGAGTLALGADNSAYSGTINVSAGSVEVRHLNALGSGAITLSGGTLDLTTTGGISPSARNYTLTSGTVKMKMNGSNANVGCDLLQGGTFTGPSGADTLTFVLDFGGATMPLSTYKLATGSFAGVDLGRFVATVENGPALNAYNFLLQGGALYVVLSGKDYRDKELITASVYAFSSELSSYGREAIHSCDGSGLTGSGNLGDQHVNTENNVVWTTVGTNLVSAFDVDPYITYDLGGLYDVTLIREWGYNYVVPFGPSNVVIYTSQDGVSFTCAGTNTFARAPGTAGYGGNEITVNYPAVRYIKLDILSSWDGAIFDGTGTLNGADGRALAGLSEIRFIGAKYTGTLITPLVHAVSSELTEFSRQAVNSCNGSGLTGPGTRGNPHANSENDVVWTTVGTNVVSRGDLDPYITYDLGGYYDVTLIREWGYNNSAAFGPSNVVVYTSRDGVTYALAGTVTFGRAPNNPAYGGHEITVSYPNVRFIKLDILSTWDGAVFDGIGTQSGADGRSLTGLSEIRFEGTRVGPWFFTGGSYDGFSSQLLQNASLMPPNYNNGTVIMLY